MSIGWDYQVTELQIKSICRFICVTVINDETLCYKVNRFCINHVWTAVQKRCIGHPYLYGKTGCLTIHKSKNIQRTITKSSMVNWNGMFNVEKNLVKIGSGETLGEEWLCHMFVPFYVPTRNISFGIAFWNNHSTDLYGWWLKIFVFIKLVPFYYVIYEKNKFKTVMKHFIEIA